MSLKIAENQQRLVAGVFIVIGLLVPSQETKRRVTTADNWCAIANSAKPGDEVVFAPGNYSEPCSIRVSGSPEKVILFRSESEAQLARFNYRGSTANVLQVFGSYVTIQGFEFEPNSSDVLTLRVMGNAENVTIERNRFGGVSNVAVSANAGDTANLVIRDNVFRNLENTAVYIGCHDGSCSSTNLLFERNYINGVRAPDANSVGYGIEVKLNSWGVIRDNTIVNAKGPPIMVYGSDRGDPASTIEGNYVEGSRNEGGIVIGGGPAIVRNNISVNNAGGGISAQNYNQRNLQRRVWIVYNTLINNGDAGISIQGWGNGADNVIAYNAILSRTLVPPLRPSTPAGTVTANVVCTADCFVNALIAPFDLWPGVQSPLVDAASINIADWNPPNDFMGEARGLHPDVGALERTPSAIDHHVSGMSLRPARVPVR